MGDEQGPDRPLGWYADPDGSGRERLWSGTEWTTSTRASDPVASGTVGSGRRLRWPFLLVLLIAAAGALGLVVVHRHRVDSAGHHLAGSITIEDETRGTVGVDCSPESPGYRDIDVGTEVSIYDATGKVIATTALEQGVISAQHRCAFPFEADVPNSSFYQVEVGHRGRVQFAKSDLELNGWDAELTLGSS